MKSPARPRQDHRLREIDPWRLEAVRRQAADRRSQAASSGAGLLPALPSMTLAPPRTRDGDPGDLVIKNLGVKYGDHVAVGGIDVQVPAGTCVAVLGANGAGKTSLLSAISGLQRPVTGNLRFAGVHIERFPAHRIARLGVCHIPEGRGVFPDLSVSDNLRMTLGGGDEVLEQAVERFPRLRSRLTQRAGSLSGGEQQMLALAPAVVTSYRLLLVDELSLGLAPVIVDELFTVLEDIRRRGVSIVVVEQFAERALALADTTYVMRKGNVVLVAPASDLRGKENVLRDIYLGGHRDERPKGRPRTTRSIKQGGPR